MLVISVGATGIQIVEARDAAKHPTMPRKVPYNKELSNINTNSAEVEKSGPRKIKSFVK